MLTMMPYAIIARKMARYYSERDSDKVPVRLLLMAYACAFSGARRLLMAAGVIYDAVMRRWRDGPDGCYTLAFTRCRYRAQC